MKTIFKRYAILILLGFNSIFQAQESKEILELKREISTSREDKVEFAKYSTKLAGLYFTNMSIDSAIVYTNKALPIYRNLGDTDKEGMLMTLLGNIYLVKDEPEKASQYLLKADNILSNSKNWFFAKKYGNDIFAKWK